MDREKLRVYGTQVRFGDACIKLYKIRDEGVHSDAGVPPKQRLHSHFYYECHFLIRGEYPFFADGRTVAVKIAQMLAIPPGTNHCPFCGGTAQDLVIGMTVEQVPGESGFYRYFSETLNALALRPVTLGADVLGKLETYSELCTGDSLGQYCRAKTAAYGVVCGIFEAINGFASGLPYDRQKDDSTLFLLERFVTDTQYSLSEIGQQLGYSSRHTARLIRRIYGKSLTELRAANRKGPKAEHRKEACRNEKVINKTKCL